MCNNQCALYFSFAHDSLLPGGQGLAMDRQLIRKADVQELRHDPSL